MNDNIDAKTVAGFGDEWQRFDQSALDPEEQQVLFERYFNIFPWSNLPANATGFDMGCGSGRWAAHVAPRVGHLLCIDPSDRALEVARRNLTGLDNCEFVQAGVDAAPVEAGSMDFGYALGVLHHIPDTAAALRSCTDKLKPGAPFLLYLYYAFDNRPAWFRGLWRLSDGLRRLISKLPFGFRSLVAQLIAGLVYFPVARLAAGAERLGLPVENIPLAAYRGSSFYTMRTDALDRFGTRLEQRFTRGEIKQMMAAAGLENITFSAEVPYWCAVGYKTGN